MNALSILNRTKGFAYGDSALRWMGILLREESNTEVYRLGGDDFAVLLKLRTREEHLELIQRIIKRMELEAKLLGFPDTAADIALVFFDQTPTSLDTVLMQMGEAMSSVKNNREFSFMLFNPTDFKISRQSSETWQTDSETKDSYATRWLSVMSIFQVLEMGKILDKTQEDVYTDVVSGLPNSKAALLSLEKAIQNSTALLQHFSILMIDGDGIRAYNGINYAAGDEMIRAMGAVLRENSRPSDFVARWRSGDDFIAILPDTTLSGARAIAEHTRLAIREASKTWRLPVTVSIGIARCPDHGENANALIEKVEHAGECAKQMGKEQIVIAE